MEEEEIIAPEAAEEPKESQKDIDWRKARQAMKTMKGHLASVGKKVDDEGNVIEEKGLSIEDVDRRASELVEKKFIEKSVKAAEKEYNEDDQAIFRKYYSKAVAGEEVTSDNVDEFITMAKNMASGAVGRNLAHRSPHGGVPNLEDNETPTYSGAVAKMAAMSGIKFNEK